MDHAGPLRRLLPLQPHNILHPPSNANRGQLLEAADGSASRRAALFPAVTKADSWQTQSPLWPPAAETLSLSVPDSPAAGLHVYTCEKMHKPGGKSSFLMLLEKNSVSFGDFSIAINQQQPRFHLFLRIKCGF